MNRVRFLKIAFAFLVVVFLSVSCEKNDLLSPQEQETSLSVTIYGLDALGPGARYVLWTVYDSSKVEVFSEIDSFKVTGTDQSFEKTYDLNMGLLQKLNTILLSAETEDSLTAPGNYRVLAAKVKANEGTFSVGDDYLLKFDITKATGSFKVTTDEASGRVVGVWFVKGDTLLEPGLDLPKAKGLWKYTAYVIKDGKRYDMGNFIDPADKDLSNAHGTPSYAYPGENFLVDPETGDSLNVDLSGGEVYVEIIPPTLQYDSNGDGQKEEFPPFQLIMFKGQIPQNATPGNDYELVNNSSSFPGGTIKININLFK